MTQKFEYCCECGAETGRDGRGDDSIYDDEDDSGPYCPECWDERQKQTAQDNGRFGVGA